LADVSVVLDTTVLVDVLRRSQAARDFIQGLEGQPWCSEVTRVEIVRGLRAAERASADRLLTEIRWCPVDENVARAAGELGRRFRGSHRHVSTADLIVGATAQRLGLPLATSNLKHFPMFPRLKPPY
jgi:predicted nucleic acid-binding protein